MKNDGTVYGVNAKKTLYVRDGVTANNPTGKYWRAVAATSFNHVSAGSSSLYGIDVKMDIFRHNGKIFE